jgi:hypothetical protein
MIKLYMNLMAEQKFDLNLIRIDFIANSIKFCSKCSAVTVLHVFWISSHGSDKMLK